IMASTDGKTKRLTRFLTDVLKRMSGLKATGPEDMAKYPAKLMLCVAVSSTDKWPIRQATTTVACIDGHIQKLPIRRWAVWH
ncbi:hypothetical protein RA276_30760, partial [Pseudomonas syringae pv. tagetis]|uniref:hypothetical protein n=1 Tax=Pseudomonas syringae group genomosp. 7 TaxID=251699 RepID=UPI00376F937A